MSQKGSRMTAQGSEFVVKRSKKPTPRFAALCLCSFACDACEQGSMWAPGALLSPERLCHLSQMHSKQENCVSQCDPGDPQTTLPTPGPPPSFPEAPLSPPGHASDFFAFFGSPCLCNLRCLAPLDFPVNGLGKCFSYVVLWALLSLSPSLSVSQSLSSLHDQGSLPSAAPTILFFPKSRLCTFLPSTMWPLFLLLVVQFVL